MGCKIIQVRESDFKLVGWLIFYNRPTLFYLSPSQVHLAFVPGALYKVDLVARRRGLLPRSYLLIRAEFIYRLAPKGKLLRGGNFFCNSQAWDSIHAYFQLHYAMIQLSNLTVKSWTNPNPCLAIYCLSLFLI